MSVTREFAAINPATGNPFLVAERNAARPGNFETARKALAKLRQYDENLYQGYAETWNVAREEGRYTYDFAYAQSNEVFKLVDTLRAQGTGTQTPRETFNVPTGRYAVTGTDGDTKFYRVVVGDGGFIKVQVQASSDLHEVRWAVATGVLRQIEADGIEAARTRYGRELGRCWDCGRVLTDAASREAGIGPICAAK